MAAPDGRAGQILGWIELPLDLNARAAVREVLPNVDIHPSPAPTDVRATARRAAWQVKVCVVDGPSRATRARLVRQQR